MLVIWSGDGGSEVLKNSFWLLWCDQRWLKYKMHLEGLRSKQIYKDMLNILGKEFPSYETVKNWNAKFGKNHTIIKHLYLKGLRCQQF